MTLEEIKEYLGTMVEVEKEYYLHERLLQTLKKRMEPLGHPKNIVEPQLKKVPEPAEAKFNLFAFLIYMFIGGLIGYIACDIIFGIPIGIITSLTIEEAENKCGVIGAVLGAIWGILFVASSISDAKDQMTKIPVENQALLQKYHQAVAADK